MLCARGENFGALRKSRVITSKVLQVNKRKHAENMKSFEYIR